MAAPRVTVWHRHSGHRSKVISKAMAEGIKAVEGRVGIRDAREYTGLGASRVAVFYGYHSELVRIFHDHADSPDHTVVYVDLGYWGRREGGTWSGYHKVSIDGRHPTAYFQREVHPPDRFRQFDLEVRNRRSGDAILLAGMGPKAARAERLRVLAWEQKMVARLRKHTGRPIIFRPKPSHRNPATIDGTRFSPASEPLDQLLERCHAVVTHHSNVAVDGLIAGVPCHCEAGVARSLSADGLDGLDDIDLPDLADRAQFGFDVAYCQWRVAEMHSGDCWRHLKAEGLVP